MEPLHPNEDQFQAIYPLALERMVQQAEVRTSSDDWTGITNPAERRRLQNRLNHRAYYRRKKEAEKRQLRKPESSVHMISQLQQECTTMDGVITIVARRPSEMVLEIARECYLNDPRRHRRINLIATRVLEDYLSRTLRLVHLQPLVRINTFLALRHNAQVLSLDQIWLSNVSSPFVQVTGHPVPGEQDENPCENSRDWPQQLRPTQVQRVLHHCPWIDVLPHPMLRDKILEALEVPSLVDAYDLCHDLIDLNEDLGSGRPSLLSWDSPWDPQGWEVSVAFLQKWCWLLRGCDTLLASTNKWREKRGERRLVFKVEEAPQ